MCKRVCVYLVYHIFFIHSSVDGCLGCIHILAIVNNTSRNIGRHVSFRISFFFFFNIYLGVALLSQMVVLFLVFRDAFILFLTVTAPIYTPMNSVQGFPFPHILADTCYCVLSDDSHSDVCEVISHCGFDLHFPDD